jgi:Sec-independent protein translocase protein TatA
LNLPVVVWAFGGWEGTLDVHAPHEPIGSWKDFLLHLLIITVGLLIAVGIEGLVELHREHVLVKEARATMREEIQDNLNSMKNAEENLKKQKAMMQKNMDALTRIQENPKDKEAQNASIDASYSMVGLRDTAWKTAQTTGALSFMPYAEAQRYSNVYGSQNDFLGQQSKILEDEAQFLGVIAKTNFGHNGITPEQASMAMERFGIWNAHLAYLDLMAQVTTQTDQAFLEGKEPPHSMHLEMGGSGK